MTQARTEAAIAFGHTFGRHHAEPPPLPASVQAGVMSDGLQMGESTAPSLQTYAGSLPNDFDQLVRSVGEW